MCAKCGTKDVTLYDQKFIEENLNSLLTETSLSDVTCEVNGKQFQLHKNILAIGSPTFKRIFTNNLEEVKSGRLKVSDISKEAFEEATRYLYTGKVPNMRRFALELFEFADKVGCEARMFAIYLLIVLFIPNQSICYFSTKCPH